MFIKSITLFLLTIPFLGIASGIEVEKWTKIDEKDGVNVFQGVVYGSDMVAFKGDTIIKASLEKIVSVIYDPKLVNDWVMNLVERKQLSSKTPYDKIMYTESYAPWPVSNRLFIYSAKINLSRDKKRVDYVMGDIDEKYWDKAPKVTGGVRGILHNSAYIIEDLGNGNSRIEVRVLADPKGWLPNWLVTYFQKKWPAKTLSKLRDLCEDPSYKSLPVIKKLFK